MHRFKKILTVIDPAVEQQQALASAEALAVANGASVKLLTVIEPVTGAFRSVLPHGGKDFEQKANEEAAGVLSKLADDLKQKGVNAAWSVATGPCAIETIREVLRDGHDLVVKDSEDESDGAIGGSDMRLLRKCPCPVWLVSRKAKPQLRTILAAVDTSYTDEAEEELSRNIIRLGNALAEHEGAELHVVHAWTQPGFSYHSRRMSADEFGAYLKQAEINNRERFDALLKEFDLEVSHPNVHLEQGEPEVVVPAAADRILADLIVMGTIARAGLSGLLMGNTAERVLRSVRRSVLAVKPAGFVSPVTLD